MEKFEIIIKMLFHLLAKKKTSIKELANRYELSERTIGRYLDTLDLAHIPLIRQKGKNGGVFLDPDYKLDRTFFTKKEFDTMLKALEACKGVSFENNDELINKLETINDNYSLSLGDSEFYIDSQSFINNTFFKEKINDITVAIKDRKVIEITYSNRDDEESTRKIEPHTLILKAGIFYLYAYCLTKNDFRLFKIGRIKQYNILNEIFTRREIEKIDLQIKNPKQVNLELEIDASIQNEVAEWISIENITKNGDKCLVKALVPEDEELIKKILSLGDKVKIISPTSMMNTLKEKCENIINLYK